MDFRELLSVYAVFHEMLRGFFVRNFHNTYYFMRCFLGFFVRCFHNMQSSIRRYVDFCEVLSQYAVFHEMFGWTSFHGLL